MVFEHYMSNASFYAFLWNKPVVNLSTGPPQNYTVSRSEGCKLPPCTFIVTACYTLGILLNLMAIVHLRKKRSFRNCRYSYMLKCLITNNLVGLFGMIFLYYMTLRQPSHLSYELDSQISRWICRGRVLCRVFGLNSGCVALVMAVERWLALTKPFTYQQVVTKTRLGYTIFSLWLFSTLWTCLPLVGFGSYYNEENFRCLRYRDATEMGDVIYAYLMFFLGIFLCIGIAVFNMTVSKVLRRAYMSRHGSTTSLHSTKTGRHATKTQFQVSGRQRNYFQTAPSSEEIRFAKLMLILSISFVLCWCPQMITIPLTTFSSKDNRFSYYFCRVADILLLIHFVADPFIYVLFRNRRPTRPARKTFTLRRIFLSPHPKQVCSVIENGTHVPNNSYQDPVTPSSMFPPGVQITWSDSVGPPTPDSVRNQKF